MIGMGIGWFAVCAPPVLAQSGPSATTLWEQVSGSVFRKQWVNVLNDVQKILNREDCQDLCQARGRMMRAHAYLETNQYAEAVQSLQGYPRLANLAAQNTIDLFYAYALKTYLSRVVSIPTMLQSASAVEMTAWMRGHLEGTIKKIYRKLWQRRTLWGQLSVDVFYQQAFHLGEDTRNFPLHTPSGKSDWTFRDVLSYEMAGFLSTQGPENTEKAVLVLQDLIAWYAHNGDQREAQRAVASWLPIYQLLSPAQQDQVLRSLRKLVPTANRTLPWLGGTQQLAHAKSERDQGPI